MADLDPTNPTDNSIVSQFPGNERAARAAQETIIYSEHGEDEGRHKFGVGNDAARDAISNWFIGGIFFNTKTTPATLQRVISIDPDVWEDITHIQTIPATTKMCFFQASVPTGWTQDTSQNDKVFRVVDGSGGGSAGNWTISGVTVNNHTLDITQIPAHDHDYSFRTGLAPQSGSNTFCWIGTATATTTPTGGGLGHNHGVTADGNWRPAYIDIIIGTKN